MLGHRGGTSEENVFRLTSGTISDVGKIIDLMLLYMTRYPTLQELHSLLGKKKLLPFLDLFGGLSIPIPNGDDGSFDAEYSLLPEVGEVVGEAALSEILAFYGGRKLNVPPTDVIRRAIRSADVYVRLEGRGEDRQGAAALARHYCVSSREVWSYFRQISRLLAPCNIPDNVLSFSTTLSVIEVGSVTAVG